MINTTAGHQDVRFPAAEEEEIILCFQENKEERFRPAFYCITLQAEGWIFKDIQAPKDADGC